MPTEKLMIPFILRRDRSDLHVAGHFNGHHSYKKIEAFIVRYPQEMIGIVLTDLADNQIRLVSSEEMQQLALDVDIPTTICEMSFFESESKNRPVLTIVFATPEGEQVEVICHCAHLPLERRGGAGYGSNMDQVWNQQVFFRDRSSPLTRDSHISIDGTRYRFQSYQRFPATQTTDYYTQDYYMISFGAQTMTFSEARCPTAETAGECWCWKAERSNGESSVMQYAIQKAKDGRLMVSDGMHSFQLLHNQNGFLLQGMSIGLGEKNKPVSVRFSPGVPVWPYRKEGGYKIDVELRLPKELRTLKGNAEVYIFNDKIEYHLYPSGKLKASAAAYVVKIQKADDTLSVITNATPSEIPDDEKFKNLGDVFANLFSNIKNDKKAGR